MFGWRSRKREDRGVALPQIGRHSNLEILLQQDVAVIFKHSPVCSVSWAAHAVVSRFHRNNPRLPLYELSVIAERETSRFIAQRTGVVHQSPQIILLRQGVAVSAASHGGITSQYLAGLASDAGHAAVREDREAGAASFDLFPEQASAPNLNSE